MSKFVTYAYQQMAGSGFAVLSPEVAATLRPDLFASGNDAAGYLSQANAHRQFHGLRGVSRLVAKIGGVANQGAPIIVLTRSMDDLERRIEQVTGFKVIGIEPEVSTMQSAAATVTPSPAAVLDHEAERLDKLRAMATRELPNYHCTDRTEILKARRELEAAGEAVEGFTPM